MKRRSHIIPFCLILLLFSCNDGNSFGDAFVVFPKEITGAQGSGTYADPYNYIAAIIKAKAGENTNREYYIKGRISEIGHPFDMETGATSFYISDDGTTIDQFQIYSAYYLGNTRWKEGNMQIRVGDDVIIYGQLDNYYGTPVTDQAYVCSLNGKIKDEAKGSGTLADPFNTVAATHVASALEEGETTAKKYYIKGKISEIKYPFNVEHGTAVFYISDDGTTTNQFQIYSAYYLDNTSWKEGNGQIQVGDDVIIYGHLDNYHGNPETAEKQAYVYSLNGRTVCPEITCTKAVEVTNALANGATSTETYTVTGYITEVVGSVSRNQQTFWMADTKDGGKVFEAYWANLPEGVTAFKIGMKVKITGQLLKYVNNSTGLMTPEIKNATVEILEDGDDPVTPPAGTDVTCAQAAELTNVLANGATSSETYSVTGYITEIIGSVSRNQQSFWMADTKDGGKVFEAYWANLPEGVIAFTKGMKVKITGQLMKYVNTSGEVTPEIKNATVEILENGDDPDTPPTTGYTKLSYFNNGGFETWTDGVPAQWMSANTASTKNVLSQSTDAHDGSYSVQVKGSTSGNNRLASTELTLDAGDYTIEFFVKPKADGGSVRSGYVPLKDNGSVSSYIYGDYVTDIPSGQWTKVIHTISLSETTNLNLVILNPKNPGTDVLIDDFSIKKN